MERIWIAAHLRQGTPDEFPADEIAAFNARRLSKQPLAPY